LNEKKKRNSLFSRNHGAQFLVPVVCYPLFKPHEVQDQRERLEIDHQLYLQSPELRKKTFHLVSKKISPFFFLFKELNDLLHEAAFKGGLSRALSVSSDMLKKLSHRQVRQKLLVFILYSFFCEIRCIHFILIIIHLNDWLLLAQVVIIKHSFN